MIRLALALAAALPAISMAAPAGVPLWSLHTRPESKINRLGIIEDEPTAGERPAEIVYIGGESGVPLRFSTARRLQYYLGLKRNQPTRVINAEFTRDAVGEIEPVLPQLLNEYKPKFVYYRPRGREILNQAALLSTSINQRSWSYLLLKNLMGLGEEKNPVLLRAMQLQWGSLIFGRRLSADMDAPAEVMEAGIAAVKRLNDICEAHGAKLRVILTGQWIQKSTWNLPLPPEVRPLGAAEIFKYRQVVSAAGWLGGFKKANIEVLDVPEAERFVTEFTSPARGRAFDQAAAIFAEKSFDADFSVKPGP